MENRITVSIVEDHPIYRSGIKRLLQESPELIFFSETQNGKEFIDSLKNGLPKVVLLDIEMPVMDGEETTKYLTKHFPEIRILILTMFNDTELARHMMKNGVRGYLTKEADAAQLLEAIQSVMEIGYYFNDLVPKEIYEDLVNGKSIKPKFEKASLTHREKQVISFLCNEYICKEIAEVLSVDAKTIDFHKTQIMKKIGARNTAGIVVYGIENNLKNKFGYKKKKK